MKRLIKISAWLLSLCWVLGAYAQQNEPTVTFGASVTSGNGELATRLTWSTTPAATSCTASGHTAWSGTKAATGQADLPVITMSGSYVLTLACTWPGDTQTVLSWVAPTTNTDGSSLAKCSSQTSTGPCLRSYRIYEGPSATQLNNNVRPLDDRNAVSYTWTGLTPGAHFFAVEAVNGNGVSSPLSNVVTKTTTSSTNRTSSVTLTVNPKPSPPANVTAE